MDENTNTGFRARPLRCADDTIDCPDCGPGMTARLVIRETASGIAIVSCLGCRQLYPVDMTGRKSVPDSSDPV